MCGPSGQTGHSMETTLKVVGYNVHGNVGKALATLQTLEADVIVVNEIYEGSFYFLGEQLELDYGYFGPSHGLFGNGILSRFEIVDVCNVVLQAKSPAEHARSLVYAQISFNEQSRMNVFGTHLEHVSEKVRLQQIKEVVGLIRNWKWNSDMHDHILMGDLNTLQLDDYTNEEMTRIIELRKHRLWEEDGSPKPLELVVPYLQQNGYVDVWKEKGSGCKFTAWSENPIMRIDYCFRTLNFPLTINKCYHHISKDSDHYPVVVEMKL